MKFNVILIHSIYLFNMFHYKYHCTEKSSINILQNFCVFPRRNDIRMMEKKCQV